MSNWINKVAKRWPASLGLALLLWALTWWAVWGEPSWAVTLVQTSYDSLYELASPWPAKLGDSPVVIVYLDLTSYINEGQNPTQPWDRAIHARLLHRLTRAGAKVVVFDIIFKDPGSDPEADRQLAAEIHNHGRVVLGAELNQSGHNSRKGDGLQSIVVSLPTQILLEAGAGWGLAHSVIDDDFVVREHFPGFPQNQQPSLTWTVAKMLQLPLVEKPLFAEEEPWMFYYGPPLTLPHVSYSAALDVNGVPDDFFTGKVVFIGARPMVGGFSELRDEHRSPFRGWADKVPGVEVHATEMLNLIRGDWLRRLSGEQELIWLCLFALVISWGIFQVRPLPALGVAVFAEVLVVSLATAGFVLHHCWFPYLLVSAMQIPVALTSSVLVQSIEWYRQKKAMELQRREADRKIHQQAALIDKAQDAIVVENLNGEVVYANPSAVKLYGWSIEDLQPSGAGAEVFAPLSPKLKEARGLTLRDGEWIGELEQKTRDGRTLLIATRWTLIRDDTGQPLSLLLINTDITEKRRLEVQLLRTQRMETVGAMASGMAHDLNNALSPILMGVQMLRRKPQDNESQEMLSVLEHNCHRGADIVRQVLLFTRGRDGEQQRLNIGQLLREMEQVIRQTFPKTIDLSVLTPADLWPVRGNPTQLHQVLLNLCVNARDAMPRGGELTIAADNATLSAEEAATVPGGKPGDYVMIWVADSGTGIPAEAMPRVFEPFFTTKPLGEGTGLGLPTVSRIVRTHAGFIGVRSEVGEGTTFEIYLPKESVTQTSIDSSSILPLARGRGELILLVDDEQSVVEMVRTTLVDQGYRVLVASNGSEAAILLEASAGEVRLVLLDWEMPVLNGESALRQIRAKHPSLPVIITSGNTSLERILEKVGDMKVQTLAKPFGADQLLREVAQLLG